MSKTRRISRLTTSGRRSRSDWPRKTTVRRRAQMKKMRKPTMSLPLCPSSRKKRWRRSLTTKTRPLTSHPSKRMISTMIGNWTRIKRPSRLPPSTQRRKVPEHELPLPLYDCIASMNCDSN